MISSLYRFLSSRVLVIASLLSLGLGLQGCVAVAVGGAATTAKTIAQERSVGDAMDDMGTKLNIQRRMIAQSGKLYLKTDVSVVEGRVLLTGIVPSEDARIEASKIAWQAPNVREVMNELEVADKSNLAALPQDTWITTRLRARLIGDGEVKGVNYSIETKDRIVYLMGIARSQGELDQVVDQARSVKGVRDVVSFVKLKNDPTRGTARYSSLQPGDGGTPSDVTGSISGQRTTRPVAAEPSTPQPVAPVESTPAPPLYGAYAKGAPPAVNAPQGYVDYSDRYDRPASGKPTALGSSPSVITLPEDEGPLSAPGAH